ncbi:putative pre-16S rRNA nuclease [Dillenia turbinata]|uniref:Pre-16S rRNA nuclease n=1 Tax=Dillenia turbinata TaxID=194707 RepID=A0AAN8UXC5_9MAGN
MVGPIGMGTNPTCAYVVHIADREEVDEFIIGIPKSFDGKETPQSNKVRRVAERLAVRAAER